MSLWNNVKAKTHLKSRSPRVHTNKLKSTDKIPTPFSQTEISFLIHLSSHVTNSWSMV